MTDLMHFNLISDRLTAKSRRAYSQRNVSSLQLELTKNRKMINMKTTKTTLLNRTLSFKPLLVESTELANVENTPMKKLSCTSHQTSASHEIIEETPVKDEDMENDVVLSDKMTRDIQRLTHRLRSSFPLMDIPIADNHSTKSAPLHLSQVVNRVSRCNYVLRHFVKEAQKYSPKSSDTQSHEKSRRRLFVDSPNQDTTSYTSGNQRPVTPRKSSGVRKQLFASPSSFKRTSSSNENIIIHDKRQKFF